MELRDVAAVSSGLAQERGKNKKVERLAELFLSASPEELPIVVSWLKGELPQGKVGLGWAAIQKVLPTVVHLDGAPLTVAEVDTAWSAIAEEAGTGSAARKLGRFAALLGRSSDPERRLLLGLVSGELRQGAEEGLVSIALARRFGVSEAETRRAAMLSGSLQEVARALAIYGAAALETFVLKVMRPVLPMLADTAEDLLELPLTEMLVEPKLDGARVQIHREGRVVRCFSRALNDVTAALPDVVQEVLKLPCERCVLDAEVIALRGERPLPFQTTMRRFGRRLDVEAVLSELPLTTFVFDVLLLEDKVLDTLPLAVRRERLEALVPGAGPLRTTPALWRPTLEQAEKKEVETQQEGHEGLMLKRLDTTYQAGQRGSHWLKLKPAKTLDLVVIAVEVGSGRRSQWLSNLHLAARHEVDGEVTWVMLGKTFKGMTDELLRWQTRELSAREVSREGHVVHVRPELVVEIVFQEFEASPRYPGGVALRFARVKGYRSDKGPMEADTMATVRTMFAAQSGASDLESPASLR